MSLLTVISIPLVLLASLGRAFGGDDQVLRAGTWMQERPRDILGGGSSSVVTLSQTNSGWTITFTTIYYPRIDQHGQFASPTKETSGPFPVAAKDGVLVITNGDKTSEYTYAVKTNGLMLPALLTVDDRTWRIKSPAEEYVFHCEFNPLVTPVGKADFPTPASLQQPRYYIYERGPNTRPGDYSARQLRFMVRMPDGSLYGDPALIWDEFGQPRFYGGSGYLCREVFYNRISDDNWRKLESLPNEKGATNRIRFRGEGPRELPN
jgi:hypothetical protein